MKMDPSDLLAQALYAAGYPIRFSWLADAPVTEESEVVSKLGNLGVRATGYALSPPSSEETSFLVDISRQLELFGGPGDAEARQSARTLFVCLLETRIRNQDAPPASRNAALAALLTLHARVSAPLSDEIGDTLGTLADLDGLDPGLKEAATNPPGAEALVTLLSDVLRRR